MLHTIVVCCVVLGWDERDQVGRWLGWLGWSGQFVSGWVGCVGKDWDGLGWVRSGWVQLSWVGLGRSAKLGWVGWVELGWVGLG